MKKIIVILFLIPFIFSSLSIQAFIVKFISVGISQAIAYLNVLLIILGIILFIKIHDIKIMPITIKLWLAFFAIYYAIGILGNIKYNTEVPFLKTLISPIYFFGYVLFLSYKEYRKIFMYTLIVSFSLANILLIYFKYINFSLDFGGVTNYVLERAGGVYGDANNAAVVCLISFVFIYYYFNPKKNIYSYLKIIILFISIFGLLITFSKTGFVVFIIILFLTQHKYFNPNKILFFLVLFPILLIGVIHFSLESDILSNIQKERIENVVNIFTFNTEKVGLSGRDVLFKNMMNYVYENPLLGNGIYFSSLIRGHNTIFGIWADSGIISFLLFLFLLFKYYKKSLLSNNEIRFFSFSILFILTIFMLTLQTIINQPYLIVLFPFLSFEMEKSFLLNTKKKIKK